MSYNVCLKDGREFIVVAKDTCIEVECAVFFNENDSVVAVFPICELLYVISNYK